MINESLRRVDVFFYGLFMDKDLLREKGCAPTNDRIACIQGFSLQIGQRATLVPSPQKSVFGVVMSLTHQEIDSLYSEASVSMYRPEAVLARLSSGAYIPVLCFNLPRPPNANEHNSDYANKLRVLAQQLGLPEDYVVSIR